MRKIWFVLLALCWSTVAEAQNPNARSEDKVVIGGTYYYVHTVRPGETLYSLSRTYDISQEEIINSNPAVIGGLRVGEVIKVPVEVAPLERKSLFGSLRSDRKMRVHTVNPGETAYSIARRYAVTVDNLIEFNPGFDPLHLSIGQKIRIPKRMVGSTTQTEITENYRQYGENLSALNPDFDYHLVQQGETLYSLSRNLQIDADTLKKYNPEELKDGLKFGSPLPIPKRNEGSAGTLMDEAIAGRMTGTEVASGSADYASPDESRREVPGELRGETLFPGHVPSEVDPKKLLFPGRTDERRTEPAVSMKEFDTRAPLNVAVLLPFRSEDGREEPNFQEFYQGVLLAMSDLKKEGVSVNLSVHNTERSPRAVDRIVEDDAMRQVDLIIGPVYGEPFERAAAFAWAHGVPVVSPLAAVESVHNPFVYQAAPVADGKYLKLLRLMEGEDKNIVLIEPAAGKDDEFLSDMIGLLPEGARRVDYSKGMNARTLEAALDADRENILILPTENENVTEEVLARLSSLQNAAAARSLKTYRLRVVGSPKWARFRNIEKRLFFKLGATYVTTYHADRGSAAVKRFDDAYIAAFHAIPSLYSYRGYDVTKIFVSAIRNYGSRFPSVIGGSASVKPLQVGYRFVRRGEGEDLQAKWVNDEWTLVHYRSDYLIETE